MSIVETQSLAAGRGADQECLPLVHNIMVTENLDDNDARRKTNGAAAYGPRTAPFVDPERVAGEETGRDAAAPTGVPIYAHADEPVAAPDSHTAPATPAPQAQSASPTWIDPEELIMRGSASPQPHHAARRRPAYWHYAPDDHGH